MRIDECSFEWTAKSVYVMNPDVKKKYSSWLEFESHMLSTAYKHEFGSTSFSLNGYELTYYKSSNGEIACRASVSAYTAKRWLSEMDYVNPDPEESWLNNFNKFLGVSP